jgi:hypothetical protein
MRRKTLAPLRAALGNVLRAAEGIESASVTDTADRLARAQALRRALLLAEHERNCLRDSPRTLTDAYELSAIGAELARGWNQARS